MVATSQHIVQIQLKGYQATFQDFVKTGKIKSSFEQQSGVMDLDSKESLVDQI